MLGTNENKVYLGVGGNMGPVQDNLLSLFCALGKLASVSEIRSSSFYKGEPIGPVQEQDTFVNAVFECTVVGESPGSFLLGMQAMELSFGRVRQVEQGPRTLDIDLLLWGQKTVSSIDLKIPHPRMHERRFVIEPLIELVGPEFKLPSGNRLNELLPGLLSQRLEIARQPP